MMALFIFVDDVLRIVGPHADHDHIGIVLRHKVLKVRGPVEIILPAQARGILALTYDLHIGALAQGPLEHGAEAFHHHGVAHKQHLGLARVFLRLRRDGGFGYARRYGVRGSKGGRAGRFDGRGGIALLPGIHGNVRQGNGSGGPFRRGGRGVRRNLPRT